jgi:hypothetical protein
VLRRQEGGARGNVTPCLTSGFPLSVQAAEAAGGSVNAIAKGGGKNNPKALNGQLRAPQGYPSFHGISESCAQDPIPGKFPIDFGKT